MECPDCGRKLSFEDAARKRCSQCGWALEPSEGGVVKTASVRVAAGDTDQVYHSLEDIPLEVRQKLRQALNSPNAETIIIADEQGRKQIFQAIAGLPPHIQKKVLAAVGAQPQATPRPAPYALRITLLAAALCCLAALLWWVWQR